MRYGILGFFITGRSLVEDSLEGMAAFCCSGGCFGMMPSEDDDAFMVASAGFTVVLDDFGLILATIVYKHTHTHTHSR